jgi:hypothetical protein
MDNLTVALRVEGAVNSLDPAFALLELTPELGATLLGYLDQFDQLHATDPELLAVDRIGYHLTWVADLAVEPRLDEDELLDDAWRELGDQRLADVQAALGSDPEAEARVDGQVLVVSTDSVSWRGWSKHGDVRFTTPSIGRQDLEELVGRHGPRNRAERP